NGMISAIVCRDREDAWEVDTWIMSCRVLGRRVEEAVLAEIVSAAAAAGKSAVIGTYIDSGRNSLVRDHYRKLGFVRAGGENGETRWRLDVAGFEAPALPFAVRRRARVIEIGSEEMPKAGAA